MILTWDMAWIGDTCPLQLGIVVYIVKLIYMGSKFARAMKKLSSREALLVVEHRGFVLEVAGAADGHVLIRSADHNHFLLGAQAPGE
jgi:hypothetical protein